MVHAGANGLGNKAGKRRKTGRGRAGPTGCSYLCAGLNPEAVTQEAGLRSSDPGAAWDPSHRSGFRLGKTEVFREKKEGR